MNAASSPDKSRLATLDVLRGLAALWVVVYHFTQNGEENAGYPAGALIKWPGQSGYLAVYVFFVVSGFIIPWTMDRGGYVLADAGRFLWKRFLRLHPLYVLCVAGTLLWSEFWSPKPNLPEAWAHFFYLNDVIGVPWALAVYWTLALEVQYYLVVAVLYPLLAHKSAPVRWAALAAVCGLALAFPSQVWVAHFGALFACGVVAFWRMSGRVRESGFLAGVALCALTICQTHSVVHATLAAATALVIVHVPLRGRVLLWLGAVSYPLYLIHSPAGGLVNTWAAARPRDPWQDGLCVLAAVGLSLIVAWLLHRWVEIPSQRWSSAVKYRARQTAGKDSRPASKI